MKAIIVDDELDGLSVLSKLIERHCTDVDIVAKATSILEAIKKINAHNPDVVFLDIEMPHGNGFDVLEATQDKGYHVVFTTAYSHYAIKAIRANALDYLTKPIDTDDLVDAVKKAQSIKNAEKNNPQHNGRLNKIPFFKNNEYFFVDLSNILYLKSDSAYTEVTTKEKNFVSSKSLKHYGSVLSSDVFFRVNNSYIVNLNEVANYSREDGGVVIMSNNHKISVSKNKKEELKIVLGLK